MAKYTAEMEKFAMEVLERLGLDCDSDGDIDKVLDTMDAFGLRC